MVSTGHLLALIAATAALLVLLRAAAWVGVRRWPTRLGSPAPTLRLALACGGAASLAVLTGVVLRAPSAVAAWDAAASAVLAPYRTSWLIAASIWLTTLGTGAALTGIAVTATGFLWAARRGALILPLWVTFAGAQATVWSSKYVIGRVRPVFLDGVASAASPSFPSAHATGSAAALGFVAYAVASGLPGRRERFEVAFWTVVLVAMIGFSRVFLGVHFATDVAAGFLAGASWLLVGMAVADARGPAPPSPCCKSL